ncbi:MAG: hypothetical protein MUF45_05085 [Spirosomaceae bacterium]|nr:hypothetical protein [Spirosomataceae bacterium]
MISFLLKDLLLGNIHSTNHITEISLPNPKHTILLVGFFKPRINLFQ